MIVHDNFRRPTEVRVINSRLPVYRAYYGDGVGDVVQGLFTRIAPRAGPIAKQLGMKAIDVIRDKGINVAGELVGKAFSEVRDRLARLIRRRESRAIPAVKLASTAEMPARVSKEINQAANQKLASMALAAPMSEKEKNITASLIAGSGLPRSGILNRQRFRR